MAHLITFATNTFDISKEEPNDINPIAGQGLLKRLGAKLGSAGLKLTEPATEDWGRYIDFEGTAGAYLVGASEEPKRLGADVDWTIQIHKSRSLKDKVTGRNKLTPDDPLTALVEGYVRAEGTFRDIYVDEDA